MSDLRSVILIAATLVTGLMAGVFAIFANAIMPGLVRTDDRTFVGAFQAIDRAIVNPLFLATFVGPLVFAGLAVVLHLGADERSLLPWLVAALVLYLAVFVVTLGINVPLNDGIKAAGEPDRITNLAAVRAQFSEMRWMRWNVARAVASVCAFGCLAWALVLNGRA